VVLVAAGFSVSGQSTTKEEFAAKYQSDQAK
jgi:hypothetical protein